MSNSDYNFYLNEDFSSFQQIYGCYNYFLSNNKENLEQKFYVQNLQGTTNEGTILNGVEEEKNLNEKIDVNNNNNIVSINNAFISKKRGRPRKNCEKNVKDKTKGKYRPGNASYKIYVSCIKNMHNFLKKIFKGLELDRPTITKYTKKSHDAHRELFNKTIYELYSKNPMVRRFKGDLKIKEKNKEKRYLIKIEKYNQLKKNKKKIDSYFEKNTNKEIFTDIKFKDFLIAYLNNEKEIIKKEENTCFYHLDLKGFETYEQFFNSEYSKEEKEKYKQHVFGIINNKSNDKKRIKRTRNK